MNEKTDQPSLQRWDTDTLAGWNENSSMNGVRKVYREMDDTTVVDVDILSQLEANLSLLENMQKRMSFLMREVGTVLKVD